MEIRLNTGYSSLLFTRCQIISIARSIMQPTLRISLDLLPIYSSKYFHQSFAKDFIFLFIFRFFVLLYQKTKKLYFI